MPRINFSSHVPVPREVVWEIYTRDGMFERLTPPWQSLDTIRQSGGIAPGDERLMRVGLGPLSLQWFAVHREWKPGYLFTDEQVRGPFRKWYHRHLFTDAPKDGTVITDDIDFELPLHHLIGWAAEPIARKQLRSMFHYRHQRAFHDLVLHHRFADQPRKCVAIPGPDTPVKRHLRWFLQTGGHSIVQGTDRTQEPDVVILLDMHQPGFDSSTLADREPALTIAVAPLDRDPVTLPDLPGHHVVQLRIGTLVSGEAGLGHALLRALTTADDVEGGFRWIALDDLLGAIYSIMMSDAPSRSVDLFAPHTPAKSELAALTGATMLRRWPAIRVNSSQDPAGQSGDGSEAIPGFKLFHRSLGDVLRAETGA